MVALNDSYIVVLVEDIAYFYAENKSCILVTLQNQRYELTQSLDQLEQMLDKKNFFRANRQVLLSIHAIQKVVPYFNGKLALHTHPFHEEKITVSKEKASIFKAWLNS
jgi:DNA-binding LytR/AlgR family response regulator